MLKLLYYLNYVVVNKRIIYDHIYCASYHAVILYCEILVHVKHTMHICSKGSCYDQVVTILNNRLN
jgi:hypothetical protein